MTRRRAVQSAFMGVAITALVGAAASADLQDLPLGHQTITDAGAGKVQVEARCVPTEDLLKELAKRAGVPLVFDAPVRNYVSISMPWITVPAEAWLDRVAMLAGLRTYELEGAWHVAPTLDRHRYDPALSEEDIWAAVPAAPPAAGASGGRPGNALLIASGRWVKGPFRVERKSRSDGDWAITVNGLSVGTVGSAKPAVPSAGAKPAPDSAGGYSPISMS